MFLPFSNLVNLCYTLFIGRKLAIQESEEEVQYMSKETTTVTELRSVFGSDEQTGYDVPFTAFTWVQWIEMQSRMLACFARYQRAIDRKQPQLALLIILEMHEITTELYKEVCAWIGTQEQNM